MAQNIAPYFSMPHEGDDEKYGRIPPHSTGFSFRRDFDPHFRPQQMMVPQLYQHTYQPFQPSKIRDLELNMSLQTSFPLFSSIPHAFAPHFQNPRSSGPAPFMGFLNGPPREDVTLNVHPNHSYRHSYGESLNYGGNERSNIPHVPFDAVSENETALASVSSQPFVNSETATTATDNTGLSDANGLDDGPDTDSDGADDLGVEGGAQSKAGAASGANGNGKVLVRREGQWKCCSRGCRRYNNDRRLTCRNCQRPRVGQAGAVDWLCGACSWHNFARRATCRKCNVPKPSSSDSDGSKAKSANTPPTAASGRGATIVAKEGSASGDLSGVVIGGEGSPALSTPGQGRLPEDRGMDWLCPHCEERNYQYRKVCRRCNKQRTSDAKEVWPFEWCCPGCTMRNNPRRATCRKCSHPRPSPKDPSETPSRSSADARSSAPATISPTLSNLTASVTSSGSGQATMSQVKVGADTASAEVVPTPAPAQSTLSVALKMEDPRSGGFRTPPAGASVSDAVLSPDGGFLRTKPQHMHLPVSFSALVDPLKRAQLAAAGVGGLSSASHSIEASKRTTPPLAPASAGAATATDGKTPSLPIPPRHSSTASGVGAFEGLVKGESKQGGSERGSKSVEWTCRQCGMRNNPRRTECRKCAASRP